MIAPISLFFNSRLHFLSNDKTILAYLKSRHAGNESPIQFSLNSIKATPEPLRIDLTRAVLALSRMNMEIPELDQRTEQAVLDQVFSGQLPRIDEKSIREKIKAYSSAHPSQSLELAIANYEQFGFFSSYDWRWKHWGTSEDIHSVIESTFELPTRCVEFTTAAAPPIAALQLLSNTFPSVRFRLIHSIAGEDKETEVEFFPFPPFGY